MGVSNPKFGVNIGSWSQGEPKDWNFYYDFGTKVERLGFEYLFHGDHMFAHNGNMEVLALVSYWAGATRHVKIGCGVLLVPLREPVHTAKTAATIDRLSQGRFIMGVGVGGEIKQEWTAMELDPATRGARMDEYLSIIQNCWSGEPLEFSGQFRSVKGGVSGSPGPFTAGGPPVWVGGRSDAALARAVRYQGWFGHTSSPHRTKQVVDRLKELHGGELPADYKVSVAVPVVIDKNKEAARKRMADAMWKRWRLDLNEKVLSITAMGSIDDIKERVQEYLDAGARDIFFSFNVPPEEQIEQISVLAKAFGLQPRQAGAERNIKAQA